jgi:hypothetical protein
MSKTGLRIIQLSLTIAFLFFSLYLRKLQDTTIYSIGIIMLSAVSIFIIFSIPFILRKKREQTESRKNKRIAFEKFKNEAEILYVNFEECEVMAGYDKIIPMVDRRTAIFEDEPKMEMDVESCVIVYKTEFQGKETKFISQRIPKDIQTLEFLLLNKKTIDLYVNKYDPSICWFDLGFLATDSRCPEVSGSAD